MKISSATTLLIFTFVLAACVFDSDWWLAPALAVVAFDFAFVEPVTGRFLPIWKWWDRRPLWWERKPPE